MRKKSIIFLFITFALYQVTVSIQNDALLQLDDKGVVPREDVTIGECGKNVKAILDTGTFTLKITGKGEMYNYSFFLNKLPPWHKEKYEGYIYSVKIEEGVTYIGKSAFYDLEALSEVIIPASVETIGDSAFANCPKLTSVTISESSKLSVIESSAFQKTGLKEITIPDSVTTIKSGAFSFCDDLYCMIIGKDESKIKRIETKMFFQSPNLYSVTFFGDNAGNVECASNTFGEYVTEVKVRKTYESEKEDETFCGKRVSKVRESYLQCVQSFSDRLKDINKDALTGMILSLCSIITSILCIVYASLKFNKNLMKAQGSGP